MPYTDEQINEVMDAFFETMNHVQYVGARYAPIFGRKDEESIVWDNTKPYEPLTIVTYQGSSYTSRQEVPVGIDIANALYWAETGNYNSQIEAYRLEVERYRQDVEQATEDIVDIKEDINNIQEDISDINGNVVDLQTADTALDTKIDDEALIRANTDTALQDDITGIDGFLPSGYASASPMNDYIVDQGTAVTVGVNVAHACHWIWRKWASGIAECWGRHADYFMCTDEWGALYENRNTVVENFPENLFNDKPYFCHMGWNGTWILCYEYGGNLTKEHSQDFRAVRATEGTIEGDIMLYAMGTWK